MFGHVGGVVAGGGVQQVAMAWQASWNGTVRSTARAVRLRACPAPKTCRASSIATSMDHLLAYRSITWAAVAAVSVVTRARYTGR